MIHAYFEDCGNCTTAPGLTQWDYGQVLEICGLEAVSDTEIHYALARGRMDAVITIAELQDGALRSRIPDKLLETGEDICAYVYVANTDSGETVRTVNLPVRRRARPGDYSAPGEKNLLRQLMDEMKKKADGIILDETGEYLSLTSEGKEIGDRIRLPNNKGREVELRNNGTAIQWRYTDSNEWNDLVALEDLRGRPGEAPEFEIRDGHLWAVCQNQ